MKTWSDPRHTTEEEREEMARVAKQRYEATLAIQANERARKEREKKNKRKPPTRYCALCDFETEHGCPDCRAYLCDPWQRDCYEIHREQAHTQTPRLSAIKEQA